jgi:Domain of unknown function (DUF4290)
VQARRTLSLEYNSTRDNLKFYEYGRIIQKMVEHAKTIEDKQKRQAVVETIVELIHQLNPQIKNVLEFKQKLWRHVFMMADNDLDVDHPFDHLPSEEDNKLKHSTVPYPQHEFPWRHYGYNIRVMIDKALKMEEGSVKEGFVETILSYMKLSYRNWIREHYVSDDIIISDLAVMSQNRLSVKDDHTIQDVNLKSNLPNNNPSYRPQNNKHKKQNNYKKQGNNNSNSGNSGFKKRK